MAITGSTGFVTEIMGANRVTYGTATGPSSGAWQVGDICIVNPPALGSPTHLTCTSAGSPGTWTAINAPILSQTPVTVTAASALSNGFAFYNFSPGGYGPVTIASSISTSSGTRINMYASAAVTLAALTGESIVGSTTLAAGSVSEFLDSGTLWYRVV